MALIIFHLQDASGHPLGGVVANSVGGPGPWAATSNPCGDMITELQPGHYSITFTKAGYETRVLPADLGDCGTVTVGLDRSAVSAPVAPRMYRGDMGVFINGAPDVGAGGDQNLVLSFMYPRYPPEFRAAKIRTLWNERQSLDVLLSWQDDAAYGLSLDTIISVRQELCAEGFRPCEWMASKVYMPRDDAAGTLQIMEPTLAAFLAADCISRYCVGGELDLWNSYASLQAITDAMAPRVKAIGRTLAVHFSTNRADWRPDHPGSTFAEYWNPNQGKLSALWFQADSEASDADLQAEMIPILQRFAGNFGVVADSGFGHPFDCHAVEISLQKMFNGGMNQAECDRRGRVLLDTAAQGGPAGLVGVMGSGNGQ